MEDPPPPAGWPSHVMDGWGARPLRWLGVLVWHCNFRDWRQRKLSWFRNTSVSLQRFLFSWLSVENRMDRGLNLIVFSCLIVVQKRTTRKSVLLDSRGASGGQWSGRWFQKASDLVLAQMLTKCIVGLTAFIWRHGAGIRAEIFWSRFVPARWRSQFFLTVAWTKFAFCWS